MECHYCKHERLVRLVKEHLTDMHECEQRGIRMGWPNELEKEVGWVEP